MEYLNRKFSGKNLDPPKKHFIFGDKLIYSSENAAVNNYVKWNFHVALAIKIANDDALYILDPSLSPKPLTKAEFHKIFNQPGQPEITGFVTCHADTLDHGDGCINPTAVNNNRHFRKIEAFLDE